MLQFLAYVLNDPAFIDAILAILMIQRCKRWLVTKVLVSILVLLGRRAKVIMSHVIYRQDQLPARISTKSLKLRLELNLLLIMVAARTTK